MSMSDKDFLRFIHNIDYYLSFELCPCKNVSHTQYNAKIGDLNCFFGHYSSWEEVVEKWEKRKTRIHRDNLFIFMSDRPSGGIETYITHEDMLSLNKVKCVGKMIFSTKKYSDIDYIIHLPKDEEGFLSKVICTTRYLF